MSYPTELRILYLGRKTQIVEHLQEIFEHQNYRAPERLGPGDGQAKFARVNHVGEWPTIDFVTATNQKVALQFVRAQPPAAVLVELEQKPASRLRFCEVVRYRLPTVTILAVASRLPQNAFAFDGVLSVPIVSAEVIKIVQALGANRADHQLAFGPISLNMITRTVVTPNGQYTMTPKQCALLKLLMQEQGQVVARSKIMETVWETSYLEDTRTLDVHVRWLRERIEANPSKPVYIKTVRGVGYQFTVDGEV
ncbi:MAG: winged helix-turn-helix domain-containing protein [Caldilineaceae bacterium]